MSAAVTGVALNTALNTSFTYLRMTQVVAPFTEFSSIMIPLEEIRNAKLSSILLLRSLIDVEKCKTTFATATVKEFSRLRFARDEAETVVVKELINELIPLCCSIATHKDYGVDSSVVKTKDIGIGTPETWHGSPDMRLEATSVEGVNVIVARNDTNIAPSTSVYVEGKVKQRKVVSQVVATAVVASYTNNAVHHQPMTAVVVMCKRKLCVCMYNCVEDILLYSDEVPLTEVGVALLWVMLHYRYVTL